MAHCRAIRAHATRATARSNEEHYTIINNKMPNVKMRSMHSGKLKNNINVTVLKVNRLDENKNGCGRWSNCSSRSMKITDSATRLNDKDDVMFLETGTRPS